MVKQYWKLKRWIYRIYDYYIIRWKLKKGKYLYNIVKLYEEEYWAVGIERVEKHIKKIVNETELKYKLKLSHTYEVGTVKDDFHYNLITFVIKMKNDPKNNNQN